MRREIFLLLIVFGVLAGSYLFYKEYRFSFLQKLSFIQEGVNCRKIKGGRAYKKECWILKPQVVAEGLNKPLDIAGPRDGSGRLFVAERGGTVKIVANKKVIEEPFLDIKDKVSTRFNEQGLLGLAFHPDFRYNGFFFVNYTNKNGNSVIARYTAEESELNRADPESEKVILLIEQPEGHHNCGTMTFGPDGFLYICTGDGGGDPRTSQDKQILLGKILRIDIESGDPYSIPGDNPFVNEDESRGEIWAMGLRNPWQFSFDRKTGDLFIPDAGEDIYEEVNFEPNDSMGKNNYGWPHFEANHCALKTYEESEKNFDFADCSFEFRKPVYEYKHEPPDLELTKDCSGSVTGGTVYRGRDYPALDGIYIFADFCTGAIRGLMRGEDGNWQAKEFYRKKGVNPTSFGSDENGEIYFTSFFDGVLYKVTTEVVN